MATRFLLILLLVVATSPHAWEMRFSDNAVDFKSDKKLANDPDALPDAELVEGKGKIRKAWLIKPTTRYSHGVLGDAIEAGGLRVELDDGSQLSLELPLNSVFEDRYPRLVDMDDDGVDEIVLVRSYLELGAALSIVKLSHGELRILVQTKPIGKAHRWLNPIGCADLDGDGRQEIAIVETPHIGGILKVYEHDDWSLTEEYRLEGFSNHKIGSRNLRQSALLDINGDGLAELLVPDEGMRDLRVISLANKRIKELERIRHDSDITTEIMTIDVDGDGDLDVTYGLADGRRVELLLP